MLTDIAAALAGSTRAVRRGAARETRMNKDQVAGKAKNVAGKVQEKVGEVTGNRTQQAKGIAKQVAGATQEKAGDVKQAVKKATR